MSKIVDKNTLKAFRQRNDERYLLDGEYSPETSVGHADTANNLSSDIYQGENSAFIRQSSDGNADIITGQKTAKLTKLKGLSLYYNQMLPILANAPTFKIKDVDVTTVNHKITMSGTATSGGGRASWFPVFGSTYADPFSFKMVYGHKYALVLSVDLRDLSAVVTPYLSNKNDDTDFTELSKYSRIFSFLKQSGDYFFGFNVSTGDNYNGVSFYCNLFDLTTMFGAGNEPSAISEFKELFPLDWYDYSEGELISARSSKITSYSANLYTENAFPVISGEDYAIAGITACNIVEKDSAGNIINSTAYSALSTVYALDNTTHSGYVDSNIKGIRLNGNTAYVILADVTAISGETVYFGLAWSKPYTDYKEHFSIEYALNNVVLRGVGEYFDTYEPNGVITRKIGFLTAQTGAIGDTITLTGAISDSPVISSAGADIGTVSGTTLTLTKAISDATILYVLDAATTEQGTPYTEEQYVNDYGIQIFDTVCPQPCEFLYQVNLKDYLQRLYGYTDGNGSILLKSNHIKIHNSALTPDSNGYVTIPQASENDFGVGRVATDFRIANWRKTQPAGAGHYNEFISTYNLDYAVKRAICDGVGATWNDTERLAALLRMGCTVDENGFVKFTPTE